MRPRKNRNLVLIGYMGCGKSTIGTKSARAFGFRFYDTDQLIEENEGCTIAELFTQKGEPYFRMCETELIKGLIRKPKGMVIATGGGLPMTEENRSLLKKLGTVVYIKCGIDTLVSRLTGDTKRPLLAEGELESKVRTMMKLREPVYESVADVVLETDGKSFYETICVLEKILKEKR
ncbi:MAG: shikimate kinase [Lachnospiraceae bacterium]|nr:shikimate kinase [Lachnospiraceae bacterium]